MGDRRSRPTTPPPDDPSRLYGEDARPEMLVCLPVTSPPRARRECGDFRLLPAACCMPGANRPNTGKPRTFQVAHTRMIGAAAGSRTCDFQETRNPRASRRRRSAEPWPRLSVRPITSGRPPNCCCCQDAVAEDDDRGRPGLFVGIEQRAPKKWRHARDSERRRGDLRDSSQGSGRA